jgi:hypothetical protein
MQAELQSEQSETKGVSFDLEGSFRVSSHTLCVV